MPYQIVLLPTVQIGHAHFNMGERGSRRDFPIMDSCDCTHPNRTPPGTVDAADLELVRQLLAGGMLGLPPDEGEPG